MKFPCSSTNSNLPPQAPKPREMVPPLPPAPLHSPPPHPPLDFHYLYFLFLCILPGLSPPPRSPFVGLLQLYLFWEPSAEACFPRPLHTHTHARICTHIQVTLTHAHTHVHMHRHSHMHTYMHRHTHMYTHVHTQAHVLTHTCTLKCTLPRGPQAPCASRASRRNQDLPAGPLRRLSSLWQRRLKPACRTALYLYLTSTTHWGLVTTDKTWKAGRGGTKVLIRQISACGDHGLEHYLWPTPPAT